MALELRLGGDRAGGVIEGPIPQWRAGARTTRSTALAIDQKESQTTARAIITQEKLIEENNLRPIAFLELGLKLASSVAQVQVTNKGTGTGFLIGAGLLVTNNHVLESYNDAARARARFNYQLDTAGRLMQSEYFACRPDLFFYTNVALDYSLVSVEGNPGNRYGVIPIGSARPRAGDRVAIIQHPMGEPKQIALVDNEIEYVDNVVAQYLTDTLPGSSGSPVFNEAWELVALHHSGGWLPEPNSSSTHFRNEGILLSAIVDDLVAAGLAG
jgi:V8-like Glu-specific endopeptidase